MCLAILVMERLDTHIHHITDPIVKFKADTYLRGICELSEVKVGRPPLFSVLCLLIIAHILEALFYNYQYLNKKGKCENVGEQKKLIMKIFLIIMIFNFGIAVGCYF